MPESKRARIKLPPEVDVRRRWGSNRGGADSCVPNVELSAVVVRPEAEEMENMPEPVNRAERRYRDRMARRFRGGRA